MPREEDGAASAPSTGSGPEGKAESPPATKAGDTAGRAESSEDVVPALNGPVTGK